MINRTISLLLLSLTLLALLLGCGSEAADSPSQSETAHNASDPAPTTAAGSTLRLVPNQDQNTVEVWVDDVTSLYALDIELQFDPARLQVVDADPNQEGVQIKAGQAPAPDFVAENLADNQAGTIHYVVTQLAPRDGFSGSGLLMTVDWQGQFAEAEAISLGSATLVSQDGQPIEIALAHSSF